MGSQSYPLNQFAPTYFQGVPQPPTDQVGFESRPFQYIYNPPNGQLTANQFIPQDTVAIQTDADFTLFGWFCSLFTGQFQIRLTDANGYQLSSGMVNSGVISQVSADPTVISPSHRFAAGSKILIEIQDLSGAPNPLQIVFTGVKIFKVQPNQATNPRQAAQR